MPKKPREGTEREKRTALAADLWMQQLNTVPTIDTVFIAGEGTERTDERERKAAELGEQIRELLEQNRQDEQNT